MFLFQLIKVPFVKLALRRLQIDLYLPITRNGEMALRLRVKCGIRTGVWYKC